MMGIEDMLCAMLTDERLCTALLERIFDVQYEHCRRFLDACGDSLDIFCLGDDFATQRGLLISPQLWRKYLKPLYAKLFDMAKRRGKLVWFHSCGDITSVLPDLINIGADVWETVQLHTLPITPQQLKIRYGKDICFFGGVSTQALPFMDSAKTREETLRCIELLGEGGGYICGPDHHIKPDVKAENTIALFEAINKFRRIGYTT